MAMVHISILKTYGGPEGQDKLAVLEINKYFILNL